MCPQNSVIDETPTFGYNSTHLPALSAEERLFFVDWTRDGVLATNYQARDEVSSVRKARDEQ
jgi:hypothetical protein